MQWETDNGRRMEKIGKKMCIYIFIDVGIDTDTCIASDVPKITLRYNDLLEGSTEFR